MFRLKSRLRLLVPLCSVLLLLFSVTTTHGSEGVIASLGSTGSKVKEIQSYLYKLSYLKGPPTGYYGKVTTEAVKSFQLEHDLNPTGDVDVETYTKLKDAYENKNKFVEYTVLAGDTLESIAEKFSTSIAAIMVRNDLSSIEVSEGQILIIPLGLANVTSRGHKGGPQPIPWSIVDKLWRVREVALITDFETGRSFRVIRIGGRYHSDIEPLTSKDTQVLLELYGGHWSWNRRAVIVRLRNLLIAASINGMPHGKNIIKGNNFNGMFCCHFIGSRVHLNSSVDPDHLSMIDEAANSVEIDDNEILSITNAM